MTTSALEIGPLDAAEIDTVARIHFDLFGDPRTHGHSVATLGPHFLADAFYRLNLDNHTLFCDVARVEGEVVGFSVFSTRKDTVFSHLLRRHPFGLVGASLRQLVRRPRSIGTFVANAVYLRGERLEFLEGVPGWWVVAGIVPDFRSRAGAARAGGRIVERFTRRMEERMQAEGCPSWYGVVDPDNVAINKVLQRLGAREVGRARAQGLDMVYYVKRFDDGAGP